MAFTNITWLPQVPDAYAERRTLALEKGASAQHVGAVVAQETADSLGAVERRQMLASFLAAAMSARLSADLVGAVAIARQALQAVEDSVPLDANA